VNAVARRRRSGFRRHFWDKDRIRLVVCLGFIAWVLLAFATPLTTFGSLLGSEEYSTVGTYTLHIPGISPVKYSASIGYSVAGGFSVGRGNPIHMRATVYDVNRSDFGSIFEALDLLYQVAPVDAQGNVLLPYLHPSGPGEWVAEGDIFFGAPVNFTGPELVPTALPRNSSLSDIDTQIVSQVKAYNYSFPQLKPQSYTDSLTSTEYALRYLMMGSGLLLFLLVPALDRALLSGQSDPSPDDDRRV
jgi:hypothetical protein